MLASGSEDLIIDIVCDTIMFQIMFGCPVKLVRYHSYLIICGEDQACLMITYNLFLGYGRDW